MFQTNELRVTEITLRLLIFVELWRYTKASQPIFYPLCPSSANRGISTQNHDIAPHCTAYAALDIQAETVMVKNSSTTKCQTRLTLYTHANMHINQGI